MGKIRLSCPRSVIVERTKLNCELEVADEIYPWGTWGLVRGLVVKGYTLPNLLTRVQSPGPTN